MAEQQIEDSRAVYVTNISPNANEKTVSDFFSFCGKISKLFVNKETETSSAVVEFETESAAKTALLLTNALIVDRPITVVPYTSTPSTQQSATGATVDVVPPKAPGTPVAHHDITQRDFNDVPDDQRSKTSVVASLLAAGYVLANDVLTKATEYDDKHNISLQARVAVEQIKVKVHEFDQQHHISEKATQLTTAATEKAKQIDATYHVTEKAQLAAQQAKQTAETAAQKLQQNPTVNSVFQSVKSTATKVSQSVTSTYQDYKDQTQKAIEEKQKEKAGQQGTGTVETTTTTTVTEGVANLSTQDPAVPVVATTATTVDQASEQQQ